MKDQIFLADYVAMQRPPVLKKHIMAYRLPKLMRDKIKLCIFKKRAKKTFYEKVIESIERYYRI